MIIKPMTRKYGDAMDLLQHQNRWMDNSDKICEMLQMMYESMGTLPEKRGANLLRYLLTSKEE